MEYIYYSKLSSIIQVYTASIYREIFKQRFKEETSGEWKNNVTYGNLIWDQFINSGGDKLFTENENDLYFNIIQTGSLDQFTFYILSTLFLYSKYKRINKERLDKENKIINTILDITINKIDSISNLKINAQEYNEIKNQIIELLNQLLSGSGSGSSDTIIKDELKYLLDTLQDDSSKNINQLNKDSERIANELKQVGNNYYAKENYEEADGYYEKALQQPNLSNYTKSILHLNHSLSIYNLVISTTTPHSKRFQSTKVNGMYLDLVLKRSIPMNEDHGLLLEAMTNACVAIKLRPSWAKAYYRLGCIYSKLSTYDRALGYFGASLELDKSEENNRIIKLQYQQITSKLLVIKKSIMLNGERDYEKESKLMLYDQYQYLQIVKDKFKDKLNSQAQYTNKINSLKKQIVDLGLPQNKALEFAIARSSYGNDYLKESPEDMKYIDQLIGSGTELAAPYYENAIRSNDSKFKMAMMIKASTLPVPFHQPNDKSKLPLFINYLVAASCEYLGVVYLHGLLDCDVDFKRARYYFERAISIDQLLNNKDLLKVGCTGYSYLVLGHMYNNGRFSRDGSTPDYASKSKAIELWNQGSKIDGVIAQSTFQQQILLNQISSTPRSYTEIIEKDNPHKSHINFLHIFGNVQTLESNNQIDLYQVKQSMDQGSPYSKQVYQVYTTISKFIQSFQQSNKSQLSINEKIELIKPIADLYCKLDMADTIHLPDTIQFQLEQFVDDLSNQVPDNQIAALLYISVKTKNYTKIPPSTCIYNKITPSLPDISQQYSTLTFSNQYEQALMYYKFWFVFLDPISVDETFLLLKYSSNNNNSFMFNHLLFIILFFFKHYQDSLSKDQIIKYYSQAIKYISTSIPKDHPILSTYHITITGVLSRLYGNNSTQQQQQQILSHYNQSLESLNNLLAYRSVKKATISEYLKTLLCIPQFTKLLSDTQINQINTTIYQNKLKFN